MGAAVVASIDKKKARAKGLAVVSRSPPKLDASAF